MRLNEIILGFSFTNILFVKWVFIIIIIIIIF
jgi:hypothetical protein